MRRFTWIFILTIGTLICAALDISWLGSWPLTNILVSLGLIVVISLTIFSGLGWGLWGSLVVGWYYAQFSTWPVLVYPLAFILAVVTTDTIIQRWVAERSSASLITSVVTGTLAFYIFLGLLVSLIRLIRHDVLNFDVSLLILKTVIQMVIHALIIYFGWRRWTGGTFGSARSLARPF